MTVEAARRRGLSDSQRAAAELGYLRWEERPGTASSHVESILQVAERMRSRRPVAPTSWTAVREAILEADSSDYAHAVRLATLVSALSPELGRRLASGVFATGVRESDPRATTHGLLLLAALAHRDGQDSRAATLAARATSVAGLSLDVPSLVSALAQLENLDVRAAGMRSLPCGDLPREMRVQFVDCEVDASVALWEAGRVQSASAKASGIVPLLDEFEAHRIARSTAKIGPILAGSGSWAAFDQALSKGIEAAEDLDDNELLAEHLLLLSIGARGRGHHAMARSALDRASELRVGPGLRVRMRVAEARADFGRGARERARIALRQVMADSTPGELPTDAHLLWSLLSTEPLPPRGYSGVVVRTGNAAGGARDPTAPSLQMEMAKEWLGSTAAAVRYATASPSVASAYHDSAALAAKAGLTDEALLLLEQSRGGARTRGELREALAAIPSDLGVLVFAEFGDRLRWWYCSAERRATGVADLTPHDVRLLSARYYTAVSVGAVGPTEREIARALFEGAMAGLFLAGLPRVPETLVLVPSASFSVVPMEAIYEGQMDTKLVLARSSSLLDGIHARSAIGQRGHHVAFVPRAGKDARAEAATLNLVADVFVGPAATADAFRRNANRAALLHFGGHTLGPAPTRGALLTFARGAAIGEEEVRKLDLSGAVVILLGCHTGLKTGIGRRDADLAKSLADAFLFAGGRAVGGTLWAIDDRTAREIAELLYGDRHQSPTAADWARMRRALRDRYPDAPDRWAGLVWYGAS